MLRTAPSHAPYAGPRWTSYPELLSIVVKLLSRSRQVKAEKPLRVRVSSKNQIAVPAAARKRLNIHSGDYLTLDIREDSLLLIPEPQDYVKALEGLHAEIWEGVDAQEYVRGEREACQE